MGKFKIIPQAHRPKKVRFEPYTPEKVEVNGVWKPQNELTEADKAWLREDDGNKLAGVAIMARTLEIWVTAWFAGRFKQEAKYVFSELQSALKRTNAYLDRTMLKMNPNAESDIEDLEEFSGDLAFILQASLTPKGRKRLAGLAHKIINEHKGQFVRPIPKEK